MPTFLTPTFSLFGQKVRCLTANTYKDIIIYPSNNALPDEEREILFQK